MLPNNNTPDVIAKPRGRVEVIRAIHDLNKYVNDVNVLVHPDGHIMIGRTPGTAAGYWRWNADLAYKRITYVFGALLSDATIRKAVAILATRVAGVRAANAH